jgi:hypothetical protein
MICDRFPCDVTTAMINIIATSESLALWDNNYFLPRSLKLFKQSMETILIYMTKFNPNLTEPVSISFSISQDYTTAWMMLLEYVRTTVTNLSQHCLSLLSEKRNQQTFPTMNFILTFYLQFRKTQEVDRFAMQKPK